MFGGTRGATPMPRPSARPPADGEGHPALPPVQLDSSGQEERPCTWLWAAGQPEPHRSGPPAASERAGATAQDASITQPKVTVARIETVTMTSAEYASAVEALAVLIARSWENQSGTKAA
jgi:hypothetical protein